MPRYAWLLFMFAVGAAVGSFLNVCIYRLPLEKSLLWPRSHCGQCFQPIRWLDNIPLLSYWLRRGRCRHCGARFSFRYFVVELLTALGFAGLFHLEVFENVHQYDLRILGLITVENPGFFRLGPTRADVAVLATFVWHALLFCFLMIATFCDLDDRTIPLGLTVTGTLFGLIGAVLFPWPWPYVPAEALPNVGWLIARPPDQGGMRQGLYFWPFWGVTGPALQPGELLPGFHPGGNLQTGLATGVLGALVGTSLMRIVRFFFGLGLGADYADDPEPDDKGGWWSWFSRVGGKTLGLGDADLMMMAGAFLGWQVVVVGFFLAVVPGLLFGLTSLIRRGENALPFGPALAIGVMMATLFWPNISPAFQAFFFFDILLLIVVVSSCVFMVIAGLILRWMRM